MQCPNCGSHNKVTLNQKHYCADCGEPLAALNNSAPSKTVSHKITASAPKPAHKPQQQHKRKQHLLDLSQQPKKSAPVPPGTPTPQRHQAHRPAQSIHGVRRQEVSSRTKHAAKKAAAKPKVSVGQHHSQAARVSRSSAISKFSPSLKTPAAVAAEVPETPPPITLTPHQIYAVNPKAAQADRAAAIALKHQRHLQPTAKAATAAKLKTKTKRAHRPRHWIPSLFRHRPRFATAAAVVAIVLVLGGYITYLNYPNISMRVAASRAGLDASLPRYTPSGYSFSGPINYGPGQVTMRFNSHSDAGFISIAQRKTDWDSSSLLENYVLTKSDKYLTFQQNGLTIYMYNGNNAAWVNRGIFYSVEGNNYLNSEQVLKVASSL